MSKKFYRTIVNIEVLSEEPYGNTDLTQIAKDITYGDCSGNVEIVSSEQIDGKKCAELLMAQGSDPEFFMLNENGESIDI